MEPMVDSYRMQMVIMPAAAAGCAQAGMVTTKFLSELLSFEEILNQISSVSLLMIASTTLANEGLLELTRRPSLTPTVSLSFAEATKESGCSQVKRPKFCLNFVKF